MLVASVQSTKRVMSIVKGTYTPLMLKSSYIKYGGNFYRGYRYMINELSKKTGKSCITGYNSPYWVWVRNPFFQFFDESAVKGKCVIIFDVMQSDVVMSDFDKWNKCLDGDLELSECIIDDSNNVIPESNISVCGNSMFGGSRFVSNRYPVEYPKAAFLSTRVDGNVLSYLDTGSTGSLLNIEKLNDRFFSTKDSKGILSRVNYRTRGVTGNSHFNESNGYNLAKISNADDSDKCIQGVCLGIQPNRIRGIYTLNSIYDKEFVTIGELYQYCKLLPEKDKIWEK